MDQCTEIWMAFKTQFGPLIDIYFCDHNHWKVLYSRLLMIKLPYEVLIMLLVHVLHVKMLYKTSQEKSLDKKC